MNGKNIRILIYGYGNPGRQDDGLGVMLAEEIEKWRLEKGLSHICTDSNYQLNLEDADGIAHCDMVIFADASGEDITDFLYEPLKPSAAVEFTMHSVSPAFILHLCREMFHREPEAYLLHIKGYGWEFMQEMTVHASENLIKASDFVKQLLLEKSQKKY